VLPVPVDVERVEPRRRSFGIKVNCEDFSPQSTLIPDSRTPREPRRGVANGDSKAAKVLHFKRRHPIIKLIPINMRSYVSSGLSRSGLITLRLPSSSPFRLFHVSQLTYTCRQCKHVPVYFNNKIRFGGRKSTSSFKSSSISSHSDVTSRTGGRGFVLVAVVISWWYSPRRKKGSEKEVVSSCQ
jgi:hypothetical protein